MNKTFQDDQACRLGFVWRGELVDTLTGETLYEREDRNIIPQVGINHLVALIRGTGTPIGTWYTGLYEGNFVPTSGTTSADLQTSAIECQAYSESARPLWQHAYDGVQLISNTASRAEFNFSSDKRLYGGFLVSSSAKGGNTGTLLSIARFTTPYDVPTGTTLRLGVSITVLPAA